ncbi:EamA family transporter [Pedobacter sp. G11]|uniref:EamA family transporter n=1 Tax=unclassified Pedobacter TaxID=2628915 RepID=UPI000F5F77C6|nr:EamA family transporter [Pedobacter sp. G11]AZI26424.1 EamA family transporter [Pedobacter sp. G11]
MKNTGTIKYYLAAIVAFSIWGTFSLVLRPLTAYSSLDILFYRVFSCAVIMTVISVLFRRQELNKSFVLLKSLSGVLQRKIIVLNIGAAIFLTINWFSFIYVMNHINVRATSVAYLICPVITTILAFFLLRERLNSAQWLAVLLSFAGCILLSYSNITNMFYSGIIGFSYACYLISQNKNAGFDKFTTLNVHILLSAIFLLPFYPFHSGPIPTQAHFYVFVEMIAIVYTILALYLNLYALEGISSSKVGMLLNINPVIAFILSIWVYHESLAAIPILAYSMIFLAVIVFNSEGLLAIIRNKFL